MLVSTCKEVFCRRLSRFCVFTGEMRPEKLALASTSVAVLTTESLRNNSPGARARFAHALAVTGSTNRRRGFRASLNQLGLFIRIQSRKQIEGFTAMHRAQESEFVAEDFGGSKRCRVRRMLENRTEFINGHCFQLRHVVVAALSNQTYRHFA
jgi:hypothetical protein